MRAFFACFFFAETTLSASAQQMSSVPGASPVVILFVGTSYTFGGSPKVTGYHKESVTTEAASKPVDSADPADRPSDASGRFGGIPAMFKQMTDEAGLSYEVHMKVSGGKRLEWHYQNALPIIAQAKWDVVILQGHSMESLPPERGGTPDNFMAHATLLEQAIHAANPKAKIYLYETFPRSDKVYPEKGPYRDSTVDAMAADLHDGYLNAFIQNGHFEGIAPAGDAWRKAFAAELTQLNPYLPPEPGLFNLWSEDNHHASAYGSYLNALVIFQTITGRDATTLGANEQAAHELEIDSDTAVKLQKIADETVKAEPHARKQVR